MLSLVEITAFRLESKSCKDFFKNNFPPLRALEFITGHVIYNPAYTYKFQLKTTFAAMINNNEAITYTEIIDNPLVLGKIF